MSLLQISLSFGALKYVETNENYLVLYLLD